MALVGEHELSMFLTNHSNSVPQHLMDWADPEHGSHSLPRGLNQIDELCSSSYLSPLDEYQAQQFFVPQTSFDYRTAGDNHLTPKVEQLSNSGEFDFYGPTAPHVSSSHGGSYHASGGSGSFMSQAQPTATNPFNNQQSPVHQQQHGGAGGGGALEEIDTLLKNFSDVPQQHHQDLGMNPLSYSDSVSLPPSQLNAPQHSSFGFQTSSGGFMLPEEPQLPKEYQWMDAQALVLARELQEQIMTDNSSSMDTSQSLSSDNSTISFASASESISNFYSEVARGHGAGSSNWGINSSLKVGSPSSSSQQHQQMALLQQQQQQIVLKHQQQQIVLKKQRLQSPGRMSTLGQGGYPQPDQSFFPRSLAAAGFSGSPTAVSLQQLQGSRFPTSTNLSQLAEQIQPGSSVPATGLQLVHLLLACAEQVSERKLVEAEVILARLRDHVLPDGNPMQRLAAYFEQALTARLKKENGAVDVKGLSADKNLPQAEVLEAFSVYYHCIPIGKFGHLTCNQILLDAVEREKVVHVLDLHISNGMQWPAFLQALALRTGGPPKLRMSAVGSDAAELQETGEKLHECAKNLNVPFEFCPVLTPLEKFSSEMVEIRRSEALVVNSFVQFHEILNKGPNSLNLLLADLRRLNPRVMAFAENDGNHNSSLFLKRFVECLRYYSAVFDAFDASLPPDSPSRMRMEEIFAAQKIRNIVACEGAARVDGHETMKFWHKKMESAHFRYVSLSPRAVSQAKLLLNLYYSNGYTLNSECGYLALGWHGMPLIGVSAWH